MDSKRGNIPLLSIDVRSRPQGTFRHLQITHVCGLQQGQLPVGQNTSIPKDFPVSHSVSRCAKDPRAMLDPGCPRLMQKGAPIAPLPRRCQCFAATNEQPQLDWSRLQQVPQVHISTSLSELAICEMKKGSREEGCHAHLFMSESSIADDHCGPLKNGLSWE